jgi:hypothetical protein
LIFLHLSQRIRLQITKIYKEHYSDITWVAQRTERLFLT